ncbi:hypothetical protein PARA125_000495 [Parachlamydia sp. AcF125]|nr:hypothetical protein [Parachlamydia sp. AcF125]
MNKIASPIEDSYYFLKLNKLGYLWLIGPSILVYYSGNNK